MAHETHIKRTISELMVNFQQKIFSQLGSFFRNFFFWTRKMLTWLRRQIPLMWQPSSLLTKKHEYAMTICTVHVHGFFAPKHVWTCRILEGCAEFPGKQTGWMRGRCLCHYFCMLPHLQIGFGNDLVRGLCAWRCKYSAWFAQTLAANVSSRTFWSSRDWIRFDIARKKTTRSTIHTASHRNFYLRDIILILQFSADGKDLIRVAHIWWRPTQNYGTQKKI